ncbi:MAG TPA: hypothetical protein VFV33_13275 [Gemmatimonadaceae bacterium]|nr:hypothetical protein [Gemmatimonadaceae bacterium]
MPTGSRGDGHTPRDLAALPQAGAGRGRLLADLRARGARGGIIGAHRAMVSGRLTPSRVLSMLVVPALLSALVALLLRPLGEGWRLALERLSPLLGMEEPIGFAAVSLGEGLRLHVPHVTTSAPLPGVWHFWVVGGICALVLAVSLLLPDRFTPLRYYLRFATLVQLSSILYFAVRPGAFPYALPQYTLGFLETGCAVLVLVPLVLGLTFFPFDIALWRKVLLTALTVGHMAVLLPLQVVLHAYVVHHLSLLTLPTMFFLWGMLLEIFVFVAFYGWGMSWPDARRATPRLRERADGRSRPASGSPATSGGGGR